MNMKGKIHLHQVTSESLRLGALLSLVGGFLDTYTFVGRDGVFANAQTGNIVLLAVKAIQGNWGQALAHIPPLIAFSLGVFIAERIKRKSTHRLTPDWARAILLLEIFVFFIVGLIPQSVPNTVVTVVVSFVASVQMTSFRKLIDAPYTSTVSTGNLRSATEAMYIAITTKDTNAAIRAMRYGVILITFLAGAFLGGFLTLAIGDKAIWGAVVALIFSFILFTEKEHKWKLPLSH
ncbi:YoaK family protein [Paenibacillus sp. NRS-1782]|uniref:YoaK family protein n=1 Tax=unclassified Paenibacillus TaxID=185978 RepID=UPI003D2AEFD0